MVTESAIRAEKMYEKKTNAWEVKEGLEEQGGVMEKGGLPLASVTGPSPFLYVHFIVMGNSKQKVSRNLIKPA